MAVNKPTKPSDSAAPGQTQRRVLFGLNTLLALASATALVALANWLVAAKLDRLPPGLLPYVRYDVTATRRYSLSDTTLGVLDALDNEHQVVLLLPEDDSRAQALTDLLDEYARQTDQLTVQRIRMGQDLTQESELFEDVRSRFTVELAVIQQQLDDAMAALRQAQDMAGELSADLDQAMTDPRLDTNTQQMLQVTSVDLNTGQAKMVRLAEDVQAMADLPLPDYHHLLTGEGQLREQLELILREVFGQAELRLQRVKALQDRRGGASEPVLRGLRRLEQLERSLSPAIRALSAVEPTRGYDEASRRLQAGPCVVVLSPEQVRVLPIERLFPPALEQAQANNGSDPRFLGETLLTASLQSLRLDPPPRIVFVVNDDQQALGSRGRYQRVAQRLQSLGIEVVQWDPLERTGDPDQPYAPDPGSTRRPGQRVAYVVLPLASAQADGTTSLNLREERERYIQVIDERLTAGDGVLWMMLVDASQQVGDHPFTAYCRRWGMAPLLNQVVLQRQQFGGEVARSTPEIRFTRWHAPHTVTASLDGLPGYIGVTAPIALVDSQNQAVVQPIVELQETGIWVLPNLADYGSGNPAYRPEEARQSVAVVAAAEQGDARFIVAPVQNWADDAVTGHGQAGPGTADLSGQSFPGNAELILNSLLWLAHHDELIAASPRSQDIRRVQPVSEATLSLYRWLLLLGLPALFLITGITVWAARRRA